MLKQGLINNCYSIIFGDKIVRPQQQQNLTKIINDINKRTIAFIKFPNLLNNIN